MRTRLPTSRAARKIRVSILDVIVALASPILALVIRDAYILNTADGLVSVGIYCLVWVVFSLIFFHVFRLYDGLRDHFSVHDALDVVKAVLCTELSACLVFFTVSRLEGVPRTAPIIHALILAAGLICSRAIAQAFSNGKTFPNRQHHAARENIIMIGATQLSSLYIKMIEACSFGQRRVLGVLDDHPTLIGRSIAGIRILGASHQLKSVIDEFVVHGVRTDRVIIGSNPDLVPDEALKEIQEVCEQQEIKLDFVQQLVGLDDLPETTVESVIEAKPTPAPSFILSSYFKIRPFVDFAAALILTVLLAPLFMIGTLLVFLDVGRPVLFWQQRIGQGGRRFLLYKFRTLQAPYDSFGHAVPERDKLSMIGKLLRQTRLDELPQLLNVLVGDMALIGPRPLLPEDQPSNPATRLMVRPGMTGWAQVNGGKFLTPHEKDEYDEFYIRNASVWFDLRILLRTLRVIFRLTSRSDHEVAAACLVGFGKQEDRPSVFAPAQALHEARDEIESPSLADGETSPAVIRLSDRRARSANR
jgi:lipopolysaccharide/colanic/teichoic acid biosynthesis glycosyltransferase